jgi:hypothetical protein
MMPGRRTRQRGHCHDAHDGRPPTPPRYSPASENMHTSPASYATATACPLGSTTTPGTHPVAQPSPLRGMLLLRPRTTLRQVDLTDWTPNWDDDDDAAPSTGDLKKSDLEIHGTKETKLDDASAVDNTAAANQAPDANTSLDGGSPPLLSSPDSPNLLEGDAPPLLDTAILDSRASLEYAAGPTIGRTPATTTVDPMAKLNAAICLHLAELDRQCIAISKKYDVFHDLLVQTRTDFDVSAIKARVSSAVVVRYTPPHSQSWSPRRRRR